MIPTWLMTAIFILVIILASAIRILPEYERGIIFRLGRLIGTKGPGLILLIPVIDRMVKVNLRIIAEVEALAHEGMLNHGNGNTLVTQINTAVASIDRGNTAAACSQFQAFINQVNAFINSGKLTPEKGQVLINGAQAVIDRLSQ